ncbi:hypothetical protein [uncultured Desulfosarcina sp.]|uniref:hypothetical protein n=1 Tax=uncultured Desulfosarcina sp. TaxID=218289 RepID=UPI0029C86407|nr:hypothetical protein [uncultured Desulfosarcina sp.]
MAIRERINSGTNRISGFLDLQRSTVAVLAMVVLLAMGECMAERFLPIYMLGMESGVLTTIEMATAVLVYIPIAYLVDLSTKKPFLLITFVFFTLFPLVLILSRSFEWPLAAFILRGLKEFVEPTRKSLIIDLFPDSCKAGMFELYYLIRDVFVALAALGGAFLWQISPQTNRVTAFVFGIVGTVGFAIFDRDNRVPEDWKAS